MSNTHAAIVAQLATLMFEMPACEAGALAEDLTAQINRRIGARAGGRLDCCTEDDVPAGLAPMLPAYLMNYATLDVPWEAYRQAHGARSGELTDEVIETRLICSLPEALACVVRSAGCTQLWSGSLLDAIGLVMDSAQREVVLMNPYWSVLGVKALVRRLTRQSLVGVRVVVMTQSREKLDAAMCEGIDLFVATLERKGARCTVLAPKPHSGPPPLLHAKAIVSDRNHAYLGSANLTGNGMDFNVELGMTFGGPLARQLSDWLTALSEALHPWDRQPSMVD